MLVPSGLNWSEASSRSWLRCKAGMPEDCNQCKCFWTEWLNAGNLAVDVGLQLICQLLYLPMMRDFQLSTVASYSGPGHGVDVSTEVTRVGLMRKLR